MAVRSGPRTAAAWVGLMLSGGASVVTPHAIAVRSEPVAWVVFVDDLHLDFQKTGYLRELVRSVLNETIHDGDVAAVYSTGPADVVSDLIAREDLVPLTRKLTGNGLKPSEIVDTPVIQPDEMEQRTRRALSKAAAAVSLLGQTRPPRRGAVIYISNGYAFDISKFAEAQTLARLTRESGVRMFTINGAALRPSTPLSGASGAAWELYKNRARASLSWIAENSRGFAVLDAPSAPDTLRQISDWMRQ